MSFIKTAKRFLCLFAILLVVEQTTMLATEISPPPAATANVTVTFSGGGGKPTPAKQTLEKDTHLTTTPVLTRTGYSFSGWFTDAKFKQPFSITTPINANTKLYAKWTKLPLVTFNLKGGKFSSSLAKQTVLIGETVQQPEEPTRTGYIFTGWFQDARLKQEFNFSTPIMANTKIYAKWVAPPVVSFVGCGKPSVIKTTVEYGATVTPPTGIEKSGYTFEGWYTNSKYNVPFDFSAKIEGKTMVYAKWIRNPVVRFSTKGKCPAPDSQNILPESNVVEPVLDVPQGFVLEGWYSDSSCKREFDFEEPLIKSLTVYANIKRDPSVPLTSSSKAK